MKTHVEDYTPSLANVLRGIFARVSLNRVIRDAAIRDLFELSGVVLDVGGGASPPYWRFFDQRRCTMISADRVIQRTQDITVDLEMPLPIPSGEYDSVICVSTLEHVYNFPQLLGEIRRVKKKSAPAMFYIPYFMQPHRTWGYGDYFRFTEFALAKIFNDADYQTCRILRISNIFWVVGNLISQLLYEKKLLAPFTIPNNIIFFMVGYLSRNVQRRSWPTGYFVIAT